MLNAEEFVPLAVFLQPVERPVPSPPPREFECVDASLTRPQRSHASDDLGETLAAVRCFRAALADALEVAVQSMLPMIVPGIVGQELRIGPPDLTAIVAKAVEDFGREHVLTIRVRPEEIGAIADLGANVVADNRLPRGDVAIELRSGTIDMSLRARLDALLANAR